MYPWLTWMFMWQRKFCAQNPRELGSMANLLILNMNMCVQCPKYLSDPDNIVLYFLVLFTLCVPVRAVPQLSR